MEKINKLKKLIKNENIDGYIVPKNDEFFCEYIQENKDRLKYISNFSGSFGFALILQEKNYLFVDGRYTLQANKQSKKKFIIKTIPGVLPQNILKGKKFRIGYVPQYGGYFNDLTLLDNLKAISEIVIDNKKTTFVGKYEPITTIKNRAIQFIFDLKKWQRDQIAGNSLEPHTTTP